VAVEIMINFKKNVLQGCKTEMPLRHFGL